MTTGNNAQEYIKTVNNVCLKKAKDWEGDVSE